MKKSTMLIVCGFALIAFFLSLFINPGPGFPIHIPHVPHMMFFVFFLIILFAGMAIMKAHAEFHGPGRHKFTGPGFNRPPHMEGPDFDPPPPPHGYPGFDPPPPPHGFHGPRQYGFTGPSRTSTTAQALTFEHRAPVILSGNIVQSVGADLYTFRDSSGEINIRIGPHEWRNIGFNISPSDNIEISGEVHRDEAGFMASPEVHARYIRKI